MNTLGTTSIDSLPISPQTSDNNIRTEPHSNYYCSHWRLHSFNTEYELQQNIKELELLNRSPEYTGFKHEIIYI